MFDYADRKIENVFKHFLHKKRYAIVDKAFKKFIKDHPLSEADATALRAKLEDEADRIVSFIDRSVLRERIQRAKYTFVITLVASTVVVAAVGGFADLTVVPFIAPVAAACVAWLIAVATIPIAYNQRIKGGMDSSILVFEKSLNEREHSNANKLTNTQDKASTLMMLQSLPNVPGQAANVSLEEITASLMKDKSRVKGVYFWKNEPSDMCVTFVVDKQEHATESVPVVVVPA